MSADAKGKASYLSRDEERELIGRWQRYDEEAGKALLEAYYPFINNLVARVRWCGLEEPVLQSSARNAFLDAAIDFKFKYGTRLSTYAYPEVYRRLLDEACATVGLKANASRVYWHVRDALERLDIRLDGEPPLSLVDRVVHEVSQEDAIYRLLNDPDRPWSEKRLCKAVFEVLAWLARATEQLVEAMDGLAEEEARRSVTPPLRDRDEIERGLVIRETVTLAARAVYRRACIVLEGDDAQARVQRQGIKWFVLWVLREPGLRIEARWQKICDWLAGDDDEVSPRWPGVLADLELLAEVPTTRLKIRALFSTPEPTVNAEAIRQWYRRGKKRILPLWRGKAVHALHRHACIMLEGEDPEVQARGLGSKWFVLWILSEFAVCSAPQWKMICEWLQDGTDPAAVLWPEVHAAHELPEAIPVEWADVQSIFCDPPPPIQLKPIQRWYRSCKKLVLPLPGV